jgi:hypothetical protein
MTFIVNKNANEVINVNKDCVELVSKYLILNKRWDKNDTLYIGNEWNEYAKKKFNNYNFMLL